MRLMNESGRSSEELLNIITSATGDTKLAQGLELSKKLLDGKGAWRVHGGGFAGCVQALMPDEYFAEYRTAMENVFGAAAATGCILCEKIRKIIKPEFGIFAGPDFHFQYFQYLQAAARSFFAPKYCHAKTAAKSTMPITSVIAARIHHKQTADADKHSERPFEL